jgi:hypothetical protein
VAGAQAVQQRADGRARRDPDDFFVDAGCARAAAKYRTFVELSAADRAHGAIRWYEAGFVNAVAPSLYPHHRAPRRFHDGVVGAGAQEAAQGGRTWRRCRSPARTSVSRSRRVMCAKRAASTVSRETLIRSSPARLSAPARVSSPTPLVVNMICNRGRRVAVAVMTSSRCLGSNGSPPVKRTLVMPSRVTAMRSSRDSSAGLR